MILKCVIIDDEQPARKLLENYVNKTANLSCEAMFKNAIQALEYIKENRVDVVLLDIQMPHLNGLELARLLKSIPNLNVIFTTAYRNYALDGYELNVKDYLLKPITYVRFLEAINKVNPPVNIPNEEFVLKIAKKWLKIKYTSIVFIKSESEYITYHSDDSNKYMVLGALKDLQLPAEFVRVHRSYIVNLKHIKIIEKNKIQLENYQIPISDSYKNSFFETWKNL